MVHRKRQGSVQWGLPVLEDDDDNEGEDDAAGTDDERHKPCALLVLLRLFELPETILHVTRRLLHVVVYSIQQSALVYDKHTKIFNNRGEFVDR